MPSLRDALRALVEAGAITTRDAEVHLRRVEVVNVRYNGRKKRGKKNVNYTSRTFTLSAAVFDCPAVRKDDNGLLSSEQRAVLVGPGGLAPKARNANRVWEQCATYGARPQRYSPLGSVHGLYKAEQQAGGQGRALVGVL